MDQLKNGVTAVIESDTDLFLAETKKLFESILQRTLSNEECERLIVQATELGMFIREIALNKAVQNADNGATVKDCEVTKFKTGGTI